MGQFKRPIAEVLARGARWGATGATPKREFALELQPDGQRIEEALASVPEGAVVAVDIETPRDNRTYVLLIGFSWEDGQAFVCDPSRNWSAIRRFLARKDLIIVGHNIAYDDYGLRANGVEIGGWVGDTIQYAARARPPFKEARKHRWLALSTVTLWLFDGWFYHKEPNGVTMRALYDALGIPYHLHEDAYCGFDVIWTRRDWFALREILRQQGQLELCDRVVAPAGRVLRDLEWDGMTVDRVRLGEMQVEQRALRDQLEAEIRVEAQASHDERRARMTYNIGQMDQEIGRMLEEGSGLRCAKHPDYAGKTKRAKCDGCGKVFVHAAPWRAALKERTDWRAKLRQKHKDLGETFPFTDAAWRTLLFDPDAGFGLKAIEKTKTGLEKVDKENIDMLFRRYPDVLVLRKRVELQHAYKRVGKVRKNGKPPRGTLLITLDENDRVHPTISASRTENARLSSGREQDEDGKARGSDVGNLQNKSEYERQIYVPDQPEGWLVDRDWSQIEARVMAWRAREIRMLQAWADGRDIHAMSGRAVAHALAASLGPGAPEYDLYMSVTEENADTVTFRFGGMEVSFRYGAKRATHGINYGLMEVKMSKMYGISVRAARAIIDAYFGEYPNIKAYQDSQIREATETHILRNAFGLRLEFFGFDYDSVRKVWKLKDREEALAFDPASTVAIMVQACLPAMQSAARKAGGRLLTTTHDQYLSTLPSRNAVEDYIGLTTPIMEREWPELGPIEGFGLFKCPSDTAVGKNWMKWHETKNPRGVRKWKGWEAMAA